MAISPSFRKLCEEVLADLSSTHQGHLRQVAAPEFASWRSKEVRIEPIGLRAGKTRTTGSFLTDAELVYPFLESLNANSFVAAVSANAGVHIAATLILQLNVQQDDESLFAAWFTQEIKSVASAHGRIRQARQMEPFLAATRKEHQVIRDGRSKGGKHLKSATALQDFILERMRASPDFNRTKLMHFLRPYHEHGAFVYKQTSQIWREGDVVYCDTEGKPRKELKPRTVDNYFTDARKKRKLLS